MKSIFRVSYLSFLEDEAGHLCNIIWIKLLNWTKIVFCGILSFFLFKLSWIDKAGPFHSCFRKRFRVDKASHFLDLLYSFLERMRGCQEQISLFFFVASYLSF